MKRARSNVRRVKVSRRRGRKLATPQSNRKRAYDVAIGAASAGVAKTIAYGKSKFNKHQRRKNAVRRGHTMGANGMGMGAGQISFVTKKYGKRMSSSASNAIKLATMAEDDIVSRWQKTNPYAAASGALYLDRTLVGVPPALNAVENCPLDIYDLSGVPYNQVGLTILDNPQVSYKLQRKFAGAGQPYNYQFQPFVGEDNLGASQARSVWTIEKADNSSTVATQVRRDMFKWVELKFMCIGATSIPTRFTIELVQLKDDALHPAVITETWEGTSAGALYARRNQFWENEVLRCMDGPVATMGNHRHLSKQKKVIHRITFVIQPKTSIELDQEGDYKIVKVFKWINKIQDYAWLQQQTKPFVTDAVQPLVPGTAIATTVTEADTYAVPANGPGAYNVFPNVELSKRMYLVVKAESFYPGQSTTVSCVPSYDLTIRKCHTVSSE